MVSKKPSKKRRNTVKLDSEENLTRKLYAIAVERYFISEPDKNKKFKKLSREEEKALFKEHSGDREYIESELAKHNIFFALNIASRYSYMYSDYDELLSNAMYGLRVAATNFDISLGYRFSTYAAQWIRKYILHPFYNCSYNKNIRGKTTIFLDSDEFTKDNAYEDNFNYTTFSDQIEPSVAYRYSDIKSPYQEIADDEATDDRLKLISRITDSIQSSSLTSDDKRVFNAIFIDGKKVSEVADEIGISRMAVVKCKARIATYISENFSNSISV